MSHERHDHADSPCEQEVRLITSVHEGRRFITIVGDHGEVTLCMELADRIGFTLLRKSAGLA